MAERVFITDCEGPISKNDNAFELSSNFIPNGDRFFSVISRYDDVLSDVLKRPDYKAGDTLRLIAPFFKAYGVTDELIEEYSANNILLVPYAGETLRYVSRLMPSFIVSTSYEHYIRALCDETGFPFQNTYCTRLQLDQYVISEDEKIRLRLLAEEIARMPIVEIPEGAESLDDFPSEHREVIERLDAIFWIELAEMEVGKIIRDVNPVGGVEKAKAVRDIVNRTGVSFHDVMYVGDSITDVSPFQLVRENGGLTVSFNGNSYAVREAEVAVMSNNTVITSILAHIFKREGKAGVLNLVREGVSNYYRKIIAPELVSRYEGILLKEPPVLELVTDDNLRRLSLESSEFRKRVRGEAVGKLG